MDGVDVVLLAERDEMVDVCEVRGRRQLDGFIGVLDVAGVVVGVKGDGCDVEFAGSGEDADGDFASRRISLVYMLAVRACSVRDLRHL